MEESNFIHNHQADKWNSVKLFPFCLDFYHSTFSQDNIDNFSIKYFISK